MCGIAGAADHNQDRAAVVVGMLNDLQAHRGPDDSVIVRADDFTLGNSRLAVQDPSPAGNQPFNSADGRFTCVFNGEIYNYQQLIKRYLLPVRTRCDGEVIPLLWSKLGYASIAELRGMFSIAMVDSLEGRLYLARDPYGIKPLYWRMVLGGSLIFASEVRPLVQAAPGARVDPAAVARYLALGAMAADQSPFLEIKAVPPNSIAVIDSRAHVRVQPILPDERLSMSSPRSGLGAALTDSIDLHLSADVPTALLLSGGVDSATIASASRSLGRDLHCITVATEGSTDESSEARRTANHYGHHFECIPAKLTEEDVGKFFGAMQRPSIDGLNTYLVSRAVHEAGFKVALSGLGGDEAMGGYSHFRLLRYLRLLRVIGYMPNLGSALAAWGVGRSGLMKEAKAKRLLGRGGPRSGWGISQLQREVLPGSLVTSLTGVDCRELPDLAIPDFLDSPGSFESMMAAEVRLYLQATLLPDADAFSMASAVELRIPFVDRDVFSAALAYADAKGSTPGKRAIGAALDDSYLKNLATRPKRGFSVPMREWMSGTLAPALQAAEEPDAAVWRLIDREAASRAGLVPLRPRERWAEIWAVAALNSWLESGRS